MDWKDTLLPGASRVPLPSDGSLLPGWVLDTYGVPTERNDWVMGPNGTPVISGSSEAQPGAVPGSQNYGSYSPAGARALYGALSSPAGQLAQRGLFASLGLGGLHQQLLGSRGPSIGGFPVGSAEAAPLEREAEALRQALARMQFKIPS